MKKKDIHHIYKAFHHLNKTVNAIKLEIKYLADERNTFYIDLIKFIFNFYNTVFF